jgi:hypothetical protein
MLMLILQADAETVEVSVHSFATSPVVLGDGNKSPLHINIELDLILRNTTKQTLFVAPESLRASGVERMDQGGRWRDILVIDSFDVGEPVYPTCVAVRPGRSVAISNVWSSAEFPKDEARQAMKLRLHFIAQCRRAAEVVTHHLVTAPITVTP